jgi:hypothetical protein
VIVIELELVRLPSLTVTKNTRERFGSPLVIVGAVNVGLAVDALFRTTSLPDPWLQA